MKKIYDIHFWLTSACNSKCETCRMWQNKDVEEIPFDVVKSIIDSEFVKNADEVQAVKEAELLEV